MFATLPTPTHDMLFQAAVQFDELFITDVDAFDACGVGIEPATIVARFVESMRTGTGTVEMRFDPSGDISAASILTMWRYMLFSGRSNGLRVELRHRQPGDPGRVIYEESGALLGQPMPLAALPPAL